MAVLLDDRGVVEVAGPDAAALLQRLVTNDVEDLPVGAAAYAALLTPQGKILFDFLIHRADSETFRLDAPAGSTADLAKRLSFYKLGAKATVADASARLAVVANLQGAPDDPRAAGLGSRVVVVRETAPAPDEAARAAYDARRVALGVPEGGRDFVYGDAFPHDVNMDLLNGVDFAKGCYVGQEVVSRMKHRGGVRKRTLRVKLGRPAATGAIVSDGDLAVGALGASVGDTALAVLRLDRLEAAETGGRALTVDGAPVAVFGLSQDQADLTNDI